MWHGAFHCFSSFQEDRLCTCGMVCTAWPHLDSRQLHFGYHKAWRDRRSKWYLKRVNPYRHKQVNGIDTEAAEHVFSVANRWSAVLNEFAHEHFAIFLLISAQCHNTTHNCIDAWQMYPAAQRQCQRFLAEKHEFSGREACGFLDEEGPSDCPVPLPRRRS